MKNKLLKSLPFLLLSMIVSNQAMAYCSTDVASAIGNSSIAIQKYNKTVGDPVWSAYAKTEQSKTQDSVLSSLGINTSSCMDAWPKMSFNFTIPTLDTIIKNIANAAITKACNAASAKIQDVTGGLSNSYFLNTGIEGMPSIGVSSSNSGSLSDSISKLTSQTSASESSLSNTYSTISNLF